MNELNINPAAANTAAQGVKGLAASPSNAKADFAKVLQEQAAKQESVTKLDPQQVEEAVTRIQEYVQHSERTLDFRLDDNSGQTVIRVYDKQSEELIRQIPGELALKIAEHLSDDEPSLMFRAQV